MVKFMKFKLIYFLIGFFFMFIILGVKSQTNIDVNKFQTSLKDNLKSSLPLLMKNISTYSKPIKGNDQATQFASKALDAVKKWMSSNSSSNPASGASSLSTDSTQEDLINFIVSLLVKGAVLGLKALLTPIVILVQVLLIIVEILLNIILWIVRALVTTLLTDLGMSSLGQSLSSLLGTVQNDVDKLLNDLDKLLGTLSLVSIKNDQQSSKSRRKRGIVWDVVTLPYTAISNVFYFFLYPFRPIIWTIRSSYRTLLTFV